MFPNSKNRLATYYTFLTSTSCGGPTSRPRLIYIENSRDLSKPRDIDFAYYNKFTVEDVESFADSAPPT
jgi:hypothetical protein